MFNKDLYSELTVKNLILSTACHTSINRNIYNELDNNDSALICPKKSYINNILVSSEPKRMNDIPIIFEEIDTRNTRLGNFKNIKSIIDHFKPSNIIIDNDPGSIMVIMCGLYSRKYKSKIYSITCENQSLNFFSILKKHGFKNIGSNIFKQFLWSLSKVFVHHLFTINKNGTLFYKQRGFKRISQIPLGYDKKLFKIDLVARDKYRLKMNISDNMLAIGYLRRIVHEKGIHILLKSLSNLLNHQWVLVIDEFHDYKNDYYQEVINLLKKYNIEDRVISINPTHENMAHFINALDVVAVPSISSQKWEEQYGRIAAESLACGKTTIVSRSGHLPDLVDEHAHIFEEGNSDELCVIIKDILENQKIDVSNQEIADYAVRNLSIDKQKEMMISVFKSGENL